MKMEDWREGRGEEKRGKGGRGERREEKKERD